jgi:hypothetical protein
VTVKFTETGLTASVAASNDSLKAAADADAATLAASPGCRR